MAPHPRVMGRFNSSELYFINHGLITPEEWLNPKNKSTKEILTMWSGIGMHNQLEDLLGKENCEKKVEFVYKDIVLVGKADYFPPSKKNEVWEFKTSEKKMETSKPWQDHQVKLYCSMFEKKNGLVYQPVKDDNGIYLKHLKTVERDDLWFEKELKKLYTFYLKIKVLTNSK
jgi:hypothetical protein